MWKRIPKENCTQPAKGKYSDWKQELAKEGFEQCVYCAIKDIDFGGMRNFHVEHYRPKSIYSELEHIFTNLFYACPVCNIFKSDQFPEIPEKFDVNIRFFPDPSQHDYTDFFEVNSHTCELIGAHNLSGFLIEVFHLNRPHLIVQRRIYNAFIEITEMNKKLRIMIETLNQLKDRKSNSEKLTKFSIKLNSFLLSIFELRHKLDYIPRYSSNEELN